jgi:hypothetical protein
MATNTRDRLVGPPGNLAWVAVGSGGQKRTTTMLTARWERESANGPAQARWAKKRGINA